MPFGRTGKWQKESRLIKGFKYTFLLLLGAAGNKLRKTLIDEQEIILNLATILSDVYLAESLYLKIERLSTITDQKSEHFLEQEKILKLYLYEALATIRKSTDDVIASFAQGFEKRSLRFLAGKLLPTYDQNPKELRRSIANYALRHQKYPF